MILKGSQRGSGQNLAVHLMRMDDNEHVSLHELRGFASDTLRGAFKEAEAISLGTKCRQYLFSLSLNPPEGAQVDIAAFRAAIEQAEQRLGLDGQPRAIVFHEKEGRRHAHCVWSRIDADTMKARPLPFFKRHLTDLSRDLYLDHGWKLPRGLQPGGGRSPENFSLAEWQQAKRSGIDPRWTRQAVQEAWRTSDNARSFDQALQERGFFLARGDKRGFVVLDHRGEVQSLPRVLDLKTKAVRDRLGHGEDLPSVADTQKRIGERMTPALRQHIAESRTRFSDRSARLGAEKEAMTRAHRKARLEQDERQRRQWEQETRDRAARLPKGLQGLWHRLTGKYTQIRKANEAEALQSRAEQAAEREALIAAQQAVRARLQEDFKELRRAQAEELRGLRGDIGRYLRLSGQRREGGLAQSQGQSLGLKLKP